jgi:hypothetical protein
MATPTPTWNSFSLQLPGKDLLEGARNILETLVTFLEILKTLLDIVKALLISFPNPIIALVQALISLINTLFETLKKTGLYALYDVPDTLGDPNFNRVAGGYQGFVTRFKGSLVDSRDPNRPQPIAGATQSGFILLVVDAENVQVLLRRLTLLLRFFGKDFLAPHYAAPANVKVLPVGDQGDPVLSVVKIFQSQPKSLVVEWALPTTQNVGDPGFSDVFSSFATEFVPPRFLIEKSAANPNVELDATKIGDASAVGQVTATVPTNFEVRGEPGKTISRKLAIKDIYNDPFIKFQKYIVVDPSHNSGTFFLGQLGKFRYIDSDVEQGKVYFYRVRAYSGDLTVNSDGTISFDQPEQDPVTQQWLVKWPGDNPVMGRASPIASQRIPVYPTGPFFDVVENLKRLFELAFSLNFHLPLPAGAQFNAQGLPGNADTHISNIGEGSLTQQAGALVAFTSVPILGAAAGLGNVSGFVADPATGKFPQAPWQTSRVKRSATRLATIVAGAILSANNADAFRQLMIGPFVKGNPTTSGLAGDTSLSAVCFHLTTDSTDPNVMRDVMTVYGDAFANDANLRLNVLNAVNFCKSFTLGGAPPDWIQVSVLRDIVPWAGQLLYELLAKIQALLNGFQGVFDEIKAYIDLIERKINTLEKFLKYLIELLDFIIGLQVGFFVLFVPSSTGDVGEWMQAVDSAGGTKPPSGPGGYTAGVAFAYIAPDVSSFASALQLIF